MILAQADHFTTADAITLGIASVGAFSGLASLGITISHFWLSGPRVRVAVTAGWCYPNGRFVAGAESWNIAGSPRFGDGLVRLVVVTATNRGRLAASITGWGLVLGKDGKYYTPNLGSDSRLPIRLEAGETRSFPTPLDDVIEANREESTDVARVSEKVFGRVSLGDGQTMRSKHALSIPTS